MLLIIIALIVAAFTGFHNVAVLILLALGVVEMFVEGASSTS